MRVIIAPDSFKGSLSAAGVAAALAQGWLRFRPNDVVEEVPVADGGEGTVDALVTAWGGRFVDVDVTGPLGDPVSARIGVSADGQTAIIETAAASGLPLVPPRQRDPQVASTYGTGELIVAALDLGVRRLIVGVGGSATNDGGAGMAQALGVGLFDGQGDPLPPGGAALQRLARVDMAGLDPRVHKTEIIVATDVDNPLTGPRGASRVFGPQKGASPDVVNTLDKALAHYADVVEKELAPSGMRWATLPGAGAAGGLAFGLVAFCGAKVQSGAAVVLDAIGLDELIREADIVITGEGRLDGQSIHGKAPFAVAQRASRWQKPVIAVAGVLGLGSDLVHEHGITAAVSIAPGPIDWKTSIEHAEPLLSACGERLARLVQIGLDTAPGADGTR